MSREKPPIDRGREQKEEYQTCPKCQGSGQVKPPGAFRAAECQTCKGSGQILKSS